MFNKSTKPDAATIWDHFVLKHNGSFLQSFEWGEFQKEFGRRVFRMADLKAGWLAQFIEFRLPLGKRYWYCPRGPVIESPEPQPKNLNFENITRDVKKLAQKEGVMFFRVGPEWLLNDDSAKELKDFGFKMVPYDIEPSQTLILDIAKPEEALLAKMHQKWRYNIRLAQKKGVSVKIINSGHIDFKKYFESFYKLIKLTYSRQRAKHHPKDYYQKQLEIKSNSLKFFLFVAEYEGKTIAADIVSFFGHRATYLHGAANHEFRSLMAPHLLQWEQIKEAKQQNCSEYDFWGIANEHTIDKRKKSWEGFTRFKKGFGGHELNYIGYWDFPIEKKWYFLYRAVQKFRR